jgi:AraC-like DNA-binding protein
VRLPGVAADLDSLPVWPPILATFGPGGSSAGHAHHAMHLVLAREGHLRVRAAGIDATAAGVLTAPNVSHAIDATGCEVLLVFVDPESDAGSRLATSIDGAVRVIDDDARDSLMRGATNDAMTSGARVVDLLAGLDRVERQMHPRVRVVLRHLRALPSGVDTSLAELARVARLSEGRLVHAFRESVGIPIRPYLLWLKVQRATVAIVLGESLARAAAAAGFADAAHMTRTFRRMFGMAPSAMRAAVNRRS